MDKEEIVNNKPDHSEIGEQFNLTDITTFGDVAKTFYAVGLSAKEASAALNAVTVSYDGSTLVNPNMVMGTSVAYSGTYSFQPTISAISSLAFSMEQMEAADVSITCMNEHEYVVEIDKMLDPCPFCGEEAMTIELDRITFRTR